MRGAETGLPRAAIAIAALRAEQALQQRLVAGPLTAGDLEAAFDAFKRRLGLDDAHAMIAVARGWSPGLAVQDM